MRRILLVLVVLVAIVTAGVVIALPALGAWLVVADPLAHADAIFVLEGSTPARELEAAALYHRGLAPIVALSHARDPQERARRLAHMPPGQEVARGVLRAVGVPPASILLLEPRVENTVQELAVIARTARAQNFRRVILVTSPPHTRRVRTIWRARHEAAVAALVTPDAFETFDARRWWRSRHGLEEAAHEVFGLLNFRLGSALPTFDDAR
jgi:uncharacterized SAM-binding protein YcdF (DUF218 family)